MKTWMWVALGGAVLLLVGGCSCLGVIGLAVLENRAASNPAGGGSGDSAILGRVKSIANDPSSVTVDEFDRLDVLYYGQPATAVGAVVRQKNGFGALVAQKEVFILQNDMVVAAGRWHGNMGNSVVAAGGTLSP